MTYSVINGGQWRLREGILQHYRLKFNQAKGMTEEAFESLFKGVNVPIQMGKTADWVMVFAIFEQKTDALLPFVTLAFCFFYPIQLIILSQYFDPWNYVTDNW